ncbi:MAG: PEGA domain-containing protein [Candidatus Pacebacteria bacterium]|nr:PEGA domain-containing protein [Candidatus Paceibacterota bacterium]
MNKQVRSALFYAFIFLFLILTFLISLYAAGYKLNLSWPLKLDSLLLKTGTLEISTSPKGATVFLEKEQKVFLANQDKYLGEHKTPAKINQLFPGSYDLKLELEGYWPWQDKIEIESGKALYVNNLILFKKSLPLLIYTSLTQDIYISPDYNYLLLPFSKKVINLKKDEIINLPENKFSAWQFSTDSQKLITDTYIFNLDNQEILSFDQNKDKALKNLKCSDNKKISFYQINNDIFELNLDSQTSDKILSLNSCQDYLIKENNLFSLENESQKTYLRKYSLKGELLKSLELPYNLNYQFLELDNGFINIVHRKNQQLYIIDIDNQYHPIKAKINNFQQGTWQGSNNLLYANDFEIYSYNLSSDTFELITRVSTKIENLMWHPDRDYIIYSTQDSFYIINWQSQGYTSTKILSLQEIQSPILDIKNNQVYFSGKIGQQSGIYKLSVQ